MKSIFNSSSLTKCAAVSILLLTACDHGKKTEAEFNPTAGLIKIVDGHAKGAATKVEVWAKEEFFAGYNKLYFALYDSVTGKRITDSHIYLNPVMHMKMMSHSCPKEEPDKNAVNELFPGSIMFSMPSNEEGKWTLETKVHNHTNNKEGQTVFDIKVVNPTLSHMAFIKVPGDSSYYVSYYFPEKMKVGVNIFDVIVFKKKKGKAYPDFLPATHLNIKFTPTMPSMGHGSSNNENPAHTKGGYYQGKVNFSMTGDWKLDVELLDKKNTSIGKVAFDVIL